MEEATILDDGAVFITTARFRVDAQTYPLSDIASVRINSDVPSLTPILILGLIAIGLCWFGIEGLALGVIVALGAFFVWASRMAKYSIVLSIGSSEVFAYSESSSQGIARIAASLNEALVKYRDGLRKS